MWFWFLNHTLLSLLGLRKSTASALIIGFSETFWFVPRFGRPCGCDLFWRNRLPFTHKHTQTVNWSHMIKVNRALADFNREPSGRIFLKWVYRVISTQKASVTCELVCYLDPTLSSLHVDRVYIHCRLKAVWLLSSVISPHTPYYVKVARQWRLMASLSL